MPGRRALTFTLLPSLLAAVGCVEGQGPLSLAPDTIWQDEWASVELAVEGLPPSAYLSTSSSGLLARGLTIEIGGVPARVVRIDGAPIVVLEAALSPGEHDLRVLARGRTYAGARALTVRARNTDVGPSDGGPSDSGVPDALDDGSTVLPDPDASPTDSRITGPDSPLARCGRADLVACWPFDTDGLDRGPRGNHLALTDFSFDGGAAELGPTSEAELPDGPTLAVSQVSIVTWARVDVEPPAFTVSVLVEREGQYGLSTSGGWVWCAIDSSLFRTLAARNALPLGEWHHIACVRSATTGALYVDGALVDTETLPAFSDGPGDLCVGESPRGDSHLVGALDETRIYDAALTATEIAADFAAGRP